MGLPSFFRVHKPKGFKYIPRYYDEQKEDLQERIRNIEMELGVHDQSIESEYIPKMRKGAIRKSLRPNRKRSNVTSSVRLLVIFLVLAVVAYFYFFR